MRLEDALDRYVVQLQADGRSVHTVEQARRHVALFDRWLCDRADDDVAAIGHEDVAAFMVSNEALLRPDGSPRKTSTANALRSSLRTFFGYVHNAGWVQTNPARLLRRAICGPPVPKGLSESDQQKLIAALRAGTSTAEIRDRALFGLMLCTGIRIGSALAIQVDDLDLETREVRLRRVKRGGEQVVYLSDAAIEFIEEHVAGIERGLVFPGQAGGRLTRRQAQRRFEQWCDRAGIRLAVTHSLRHTFATQLYQRTGDILLVKEALGHRNIVSSLSYAQCPRERVRMAVAGESYLGPGS